MHFWSQLWPGGHFDGCSASLKCKSESLTWKLPVWTRSLTNHSFFIRNFKISMIIYEHQLFFRNKIKDLNKTSEDHCFFKGKLTWGRNREAKKISRKSRKCDWGAPNFQKWCFRLTFFRLFWDSHERNASFQNENDIGEEPRPRRRGGTEKQKRPPGGPQVR